MMSKSIAMWGLPYLNVSKKNEAPVALFNSLVTAINESPLDPTKIKLACKTLLEAPIYLLSDSRKLVLLSILENNICWPDQAIDKTTYKDLEAVKISLGSVLERSIYMGNVNSVLQAFCPQTLMGRILYVKRNAWDFLSRPGVAADDSTLGKLAKELDHYLSIASKDFKLSSTTLNALEGCPKLLEEICKFSHIHKLIARNQQIAAGNCQESQSYITNRML